jgi:5-methyltetrahydrofolate--homocysteine methyltransferase
VSRLRELLAEGRTLLSDGAMGTQLFARGLKSGDCPELVNQERPEVPAEVARLYAEAGADIVSTNTFGASPLKLAHWGLECRTEQINRMAVRAARSGVPASTLLAASVGPTGRLLEPYGDTSPADVLNAFRAQMKAVAAEGVDLILIETMTDPAEARLALQAARESTRVPVAVTLTFEPTPSGFRTVMGTTVREAVQVLSAEGAELLGSNCGLGSESMVEVAREFRRHTDLPLVIQPNAGIPRLEADHAVYPESPEFMAAQAHRILEAGASIIGGCCGTTPAHIRALRALADRARPLYNRPV